MIQANISLKQYNTFGIDVNAAYFASFNSSTNLLEILGNKTIETVAKLVLGGGSNILFTKNYDGLILKNTIPGIQIVENRDETTVVSVGGGVVWHEFVQWCINHNLGGVENLSLIPGSVGASPIQNIGAYGVELKDVFYSAKAIDLHSMQELNFTKPQCNFGYRDSIFKRDFKGRIVITEVCFELQKFPTFKLSYGAIEQELKKMGVEHPTLRAVSDAVCAIRKSKLPDPLMIGNAGSFFKNPEINETDFLSLKSKYPQVVAYPAGSKFKIAAGWLIEQCGWKGKVVGNTGSHKDQALVLVNYGNASGNEILDLAYKIKQSVADKFGITIDPEVNII